MVALDGTKKLEEQNKRFKEALEAIKNVSLYDKGIDGNFAVAIVIMRGIAAKALDEAND